MPLLSRKNLSLNDIWMVLMLVDGVEIGVQEGTFIHHVNFNVPQDQTVLWQEESYSVRAGLHTLSRDAFNMEWIAYDPPVLP